MKNRNATAGFTLVEIALALLVAGLGVIAVFGLFPQGMDASRKSVEATEAAAFAEFVFEGIQNEATNFPWATFDDAGGVNSLRLNLSHLIIGCDVVATQKFVIAQGPTTPNLYLWIPFWFGSDLYVTNFAASTFTYTLDIGVAGVTTKYARLEVWAGDRMGPVSSAAATGGTFAGGTVFYREFLPNY